MAKILTPKSPLCVYFGEEDFHLDRAIRTARAWKGRLIRTVDASEGLTDSDVVDQLTLGSEDDSPRTVIVDGAEKVKESKVKYLRSYVDDRSATDFSVVLVAIVRAAKLPAVWQYVGAKGKVTECPKLKTFGKSNEVLAFVRDRAEELRLELEDGLAEDIFRYAGSDLYRINSELRKLSLLASTTKDRKVTRKQFQEIGSPVLHAKPWEIADAAFSKDVKAAMNSLSRVYMTMGEEASVPVSAALIDKVQKVILARHMLDGGFSEEEIASALDMHPYRCKVALMPVVRRHDQKSLARVMSRLCKLDADVKGSSSSKRTLVELAVLSIAG